MRIEFFRHSRQDAYLVALSLLHPIALFLAPSIPVIALGVWWNSNTVSHHFLHLPFFKSKTVNRLYSLYLSVLLGIPQSAWRERHLAHHRGATQSIQWTWAIVVEVILVSALWGILLFRAHHFFLMTYLPGFLLGLGLCYVHGHFEHAGGTTSNYGKLYNFAFFNDGYHAEHHTNPSGHWRLLPEPSLQHTSNISRWPAIFRWLEIFDLERLERLVLRSSTLQSFLLKTHRKALAHLLAHIPDVKAVTIVGGGMFPRTAILLRKLLPQASIRIIDARREHLEMAKSFLQGTEVQLNECVYTPGRPFRWDESDLLVVPLSFKGDRKTIYRNPPTPAVLIHDWIWNRRGRSTVVSILLLKRLNLIL